MSEPRPRIIFVNRFYAPDLSATSQMLTQLAAHLAREGCEVTVVASRLLYGAPGLLSRADRIDGVGVIRVTTTRFGNRSLVGRAVDYASFYLSALVTLVFTLRRGDVVVAKTDPPLISVVTAVAAWVRGARLVNWLQDLYPEIADAHGLSIARGGIGGVLTQLRNASLRAAAANVAVCEDMAERIAPVTTAEVIHNWSDDQFIVPVPRDENPLRRDWELEGKFIVGYSGNLGRAHDWKTIVEAAERLDRRGDILFLMIGAGSSLAALQAEVGRRDLLRLFRFEPYQSVEMLAQSLSAPDVHLVSLSAEFRGLVFPSKVFGIAAAGRGMVAIVNQPSDLASLIQHHDCGLIVSQGDGLGLAQALENLADNRARTAHIGAQARKMIDESYTQTAAFARWRNLLARIDAPR